MAGTISVATARGWLADGGEVAFIDVREEGPHNDGHPLLAVNLPYSRLELDVLRLVPRKSTRIVLVDDDDGVAARAAKRLASLGYSDVHAVTGGVAAWGKDYPLFPSNNVPSKGFAEIVEIASHTPHITAAELAEMQRAGTKLKILDSRTVEEFNRFHVPGAQTCPGAELVYRFADLVPDPDTLVVVSCAGRTRSIIGAQSLINAGVPNKIVSLQGGTQGWRLAGLELERNTSQSVAPVSANGAAASTQRAAAVAAKFGVKHIDRATLAAWQREAATRTTYLLDVRTPDEYADGHLPGSVSAQGGQLVQAIDRWCATRGARVVLADDNGARAVMTAHWLKQMGWDVSVLAGGLDGARLETGAGEALLPSLPAVAIVMPGEAAALLTDGAAAVVLGSSAAFRAAHPPGAVWTIRPCLDRLPARVFETRRIVMFADDINLARLAVADLAELTAAQIAIVDGGVAAWRKAGYSVVETPADPPDSERIDFIFWNHNRHETDAGAAQAMRNYLQWELDLPDEIAKDGLSGFRIGAA
jgi:rhodanese-related sulfurtransferase